MAIVPLVRISISPKYLVINNLLYYDSRFSQTSQDQLKIVWQWLSQTMLYIIYSIFNLNIINRTQKKNGHNVINAICYLTSIK